MSKVTNFQTRMKIEAGDRPCQRAYGPQRVLFRKMNEVIAMVVGVLVCYKWW